MNALVMYQHASRRSSPRHDAEGQATTEFLVALLVMVPLFFGTYYFARYSDVKHSAIQASRYVAFERTWDPNSRNKSASQLAEEARARFFMPISQNNGVISYRQTSVGGNADTGRLPLWSDVEYKPLLQKFSDVSVAEVNAGALASGAQIGALQTKVASVFRLPAGGVTRAEVTVPLNNIARFDVLSNINIAMPGATAIGVGTWNASGAKGGPDSVCNRVKPTVLGSYIEPVTDVLGTLMVPFEAHPPEIGIVQPDFVPPGSVRNGNSNVPVSAQNGNKC